MTLYTGQVLQGRYRIVRQIGQGGMGTVYQAQDMRLNKRLVAVKEFDPAQLLPNDRPIALQAFQQEARILAGLNHPGLTAVHDYFLENNKFYLVMEFVNGETLQQVWERRGPRFTEAQVVVWTQELCDVLSYLHNQQPAIIFRDLKPDNIIVQPNGRLKLVDFSIARHFTPGKTSDTVKFGTPGYAAPEQYGQWQTDARSDIYALGVVIHQLLTGNDPTQTPFRLPPISQLAPHVSPQLSRAVAQALELDPAKRPLTAAQFCQLLSPAVSKPTGQVGRQSSWLRAAATLLLLFFIVGGGIAFCTNINPTPTSLSATPVPLPQEISLQTVARLTELAQVGESLSITWSSNLNTNLLAIGHPNRVQVYNVPDMQPVSFITSTTPSLIDFYNNEFLLIGEPQGGVRLLDYMNPNEVTQLRLRDEVFTDLAFYQQAEGFVAAASNRLAFVTLVPTTSIISLSTQVTDIEFSPDYRWLAVAGLNNSVELWDQRSQAIVQTLTEHEAKVTAIAFSPDGTFLVSGDQKGGLYKWNMQDFSLEDVINGHQGAVNSIDISMNGQIVASAGEDGLLRFGSLFDLNRLRLVRFQPGHINKVQFSPNGYWLVLLGNDNAVRLLGVP